MEIELFIEARNLMFKNPHSTRAWVNKQEPPPGGGKARVMNSQSMPMVVMKNLDNGEHEESSAYWFRPPGRDDDETQYGRLISESFTAVKEKIFPFQYFVSFHRVSTQRSDARSLLLPDQQKKWKKLSPRVKSE